MVATRSFSIAAKYLNLWHVDVMVLSYEVLSGLMSIVSFTKTSGLVYVSLMFVVASGDGQMDAVHK
jgi:hypothetical protein